ncbi:MAG TPA: DUF4129 domain-containing protein [Pyrinomonadaceae bacterium]|jgi:hypothetical protein
MRVAPRNRSLTRAAARAARLLLPALLLVLLPAFISPRLATSQTRPGQARPAVATAPHTATLADYRARMGEAAATLEDLADAYEEEEAGGEETDGPDPDVESGAGAEAAGALARVRGAVPPQERVAWGERFIEADNSWLHEALDEAEGAGDAAKSARVLSAAAARLRALEARLEEVAGGAADATDRDAERGRLNAILRGPEFNRESRQRGDALRRLIRDFFEWLASLLPKSPSLSPGASPRASALTQVLVFGLCLGVLAYVARRLWLRRGRGRKSPGPKRGARVVLGERLEADQTAADLLEEAERLARAGDLRGAIRKAYVALLCELGDRGVVRLAQHKTNRDYLSAVRRAAAPGLYTEMLPLTFDFEVHWYGLRDASDSDWQSFRERCRRVLSSQ